MWTHIFVLSKLLSNFWLKVNVAFYIIFHNSLTLNNVWSTLRAPVAYNRDLWNGHLQMPSLYYSVPPQHIIIQTWEAGLTSSEIIAPLWYIYLFINTLFILFRANPALITWEACSTSSDTCHTRDLLNWTQVRSLFWFLSATEWLMILLRLTWCSFGLWRRWSSCA